jgi:hypothetical protein
MCRERQSDLGRQGLPVALVLTVPEKLCYSSINRSAVRKGRHTGFNRSLAMKHGQQVAEFGVPPLLHHLW